MRHAEQLRFETHDGVELFYRHWPATTGAATKRAVVMFHRGHEHSGRLQHLADELDLPAPEIVGSQLGGDVVSIGAVSAAREAAQESVLALRRGAGGWSA